MFEYLYHQTYFFCILKILFILVSNLAVAAILVTMALKKINGVWYFVATLPLAPVLGYVALEMTHHVPCIHQLEKLIK